MGPKKCGRAIAGTPKQLSTRLQRIEGEADDPDANLHQNTCQAPWRSETRSLAYCSMLDVAAWCHITNTTLIQNYSVLSPAWADAFVLDHQSGLLLPPLQQYLRSDDDTTSHSVLRLWQERRFRERLQLACALARQHRTAADAAWVVLDAMPSDDAGLLDRVKIAAAAYLHARRLLCAAKGTTHPPPMIDVRKGIDEQTAQWLRATWLLLKAIAYCRSETTQTCWHSSMSLTLLHQLMGVLPDDPFRLLLMYMKDLSDGNNWERLLELTRFSLGSPRLEPPSMVTDMHTLAAAYNSALAAFKVLGPDHHSTLAAIEAALRLDEGRWVPLLLAGGVLGTSVLGPLVALGSKEEATAYCENYGLFWLVEDSDQPLPFGKPGLTIPPARAVKWLLAAAGLSELSTPLDNSRRAAILHTVGAHKPAYIFCSEDVVDEMNRHIMHSAARTLKPTACAALLRSELSMLSCIAAVSGNLPPVDAGYSCWAHVEAMMGTHSQTELKGRLVDCATLLHDIASKSLSNLQAAVHSDWRSAGLVWPGELSHAARTLTELQPARVRWLWQAGEIKLAKGLAADLQQKQQYQQSTAHAAASSSSSSSSSSIGTSKAPFDPGSAVWDSGALQAMVDFLNQQSLEAARSRGSKGSLVMTAATSSSSARAAGAAVMSGAKGSRAVINYAPYQELNTLVQTLQETFEKAHSGAMQEAEQWLLTKVTTTNFKPQQQDMQQQQQQQMTSEMVKVVSMQQQQEQQQSLKAVRRITGLGNGRAEVSSSSLYRPGSGSTNSVNLVAAGASSDRCQPNAPSSQLAVGTTAPDGSVVSQAVQPQQQACALEADTQFKFVFGSGSHHRFTPTSSDRATTSSNIEGVHAGHSPRCPAKQQQTPVTFPSSKSASGVNNSHGRLAAAAASCAASSTTSSRHGNEPSEQESAVAGVEYRDGVFHLWGYCSEPASTKDGPLLKATTAVPGAVGGQVFESKPSTKCHKGPEPFRSSSGTGAVARAVAAVSSSSCMPASGHTAAAGDSSSGSSHAYVCDPGENGHSMSSGAASTAEAAQTAAAEPAWQVPALRPQQHQQHQQPQQERQQQQHQGPEQLSGRQANSVSAPATVTYRACAACSGSGVKLFRCAGCAAVGVYVAYCSRECQAKDWKAGHKRVCGAKQAAQQK